MRAALLALLALPALLFAAPALAAPTIQTLPSGNGHGFLVFDGNQKRVTDWLERPYRYLRPGQDPKGEGVPRRDLVYDVYFGARAGSTSSWMSETTLTSLSYLDDTHVISAIGTVGQLQVESIYFLPYDLPTNALIAIVRVQNFGSTPLDTTIFFNPNVKLGTGRPEPSADGESVAFNSDHAIETGPSGGKVIHQPIGGFDKADCSGQGYQRVKDGLELLDAPRAASGNDLTLIWQKHLGVIPAGGTASWGVALLYTDGDAAAARTQLVNYLDGRSASQLVDAALAEHEAWRKPAPLGLSADEHQLWRQSEAVLRMGQVREPWTEVPKQKGHGMLLASLPPGIWHVGWVRDAQYAIQALLASGHLDEARDALDFFLNAEANSYQEYVGRPYRISVTRYFGDGQEESDWNADGPNPEYDGFGSYLWSARALADANPDWVAQQTRAGEPHRDVIDQQIVEPLLANREANGLVSPDASIWEVHWNKRQQFAYSTITAARGICDASALLGEADGNRGAYLATQATALKNALRGQLVDGKLALAQSREALLAGSGYLDAAVLDAINFGLLEPNDLAIAATLDAMAPLKAVTGGYFRNDDGGGYDSQEWIFVDLRLSQALRNAGRVAEADALLAHVTAIGKASHNLLPELLNTNAAEGEIGAVSGAYPMVGFGAGAYLLALAHRAQIYDEARACYAGPKPPGDPQHPDEGCHVGQAGSSATLFSLILGLGLLHALRRKHRRLPSSL